MNRKQYTQVQLQLQVLAHAVKDIPLYEFIQAIERAETFGPIVDPTLYRRGIGSLTKIKQLAESLLPFKRAVEKLTPKGDPCKSA